MQMHPVWRTILKRKKPEVKVMDVVSSTADASVYTFSAANLGDIGSVASTTGDLYPTVPHQRSPGRKMIVIVVHGEDSIANFTVTSVTIGGIAGTEVIDRGGGTSAINTAIYFWPTDVLQGISSTDIGVTFGETVSGCAVGVLSINNVGIVDNGGATGTRTAVGTGELTLTPGPTAMDVEEPFHLLIVGSTCITGGGTEVFSMRSGASNFGGSEPIFLYEGSNAEFDYAAAWMLNGQHSATGGSSPFSAIVGWSGTGACDAVCADFV